MNKITRILGMCGFIGLLLPPDTSATPISPGGFDSGPVTESFETFNEGPSVAIFLIAGDTFPSGITYVGNAFSAGVEDLEFGDGGCFGSLLFPADVPDGLAFLCGNTGQSVPFSFLMPTGTIRVGVLTATTGDSVGDIVLLEAYDASDNLLETVSYIDDAGLGNWDTNFLGIEQLDGIARIDITTAGSAGLLIDVLKYEVRPLAVDILEPKLDLIAVKLDEINPDVADLKTKTVEIRNQQTIIQSQNSDIKAEVTDLKVGTADIRNQQTIIQSQNSDIKAEIVDTKAELIDVKVEIVDIAGQLDFKINFELEQALLTCGCTPSLYLPDPDGKLDHALDLVNTDIDLVAASQDPDLKKIIPKARCFAGEAAILLNEGSFKKSCLALGSAMQLLQGGGNNCLAIPKCKKTGDNN